MIEWMIILLVSMIILFILLKYLKSISNFIDNSKPQIETLSILASFATVIALFLAIGAYLEERQIQEENNQIIIENLYKEIEGNLDLLKQCEEYQKLFKEGAMTSARYNYHFLEKSTEFLKDKFLREKIIITIDLMNQANRVMDTLSGGKISVLIGEDETEIYKDLLDKNTEILLMINKDIRTELICINNSLSKD